MCSIKIFEVFTDLSLLPHFIFVSPTLFCLKMFIPLSIFASILKKKPYFTGSINGIK